MDRYLTENEVLKIVGCSRASLWRWQNAGKFPSRRRISTGRVGYLQSEVLKWITDRPPAVNCPRQIVDSFSEVP